MKTEIWIALSVYLLVAIVKKRPGLEVKPLQTSADSERHPFDNKTSISIALSDVGSQFDYIDDRNQQQ